MRKILACAGAALVLSGCATVTRGTKEAMVVETDPIGANVTLSNEYMGADVVCTTPCSVEMPRKRGFNVKIEKAGFETVETKVITRIEGGGSAGMAGNVLLGGVIGAGVDVATGAMRGFSPNPLVIELVPEGTTMDEMEPEETDDAEPIQELEAESDETGS